ncbi:MAG TPA: DUF6298 domain-containing protein [Chitinophagaceae bacterium]|nr:DUF6298 domain-containing protein [Chitinophagaceae bacterium]
MPPVSQVNGKLVYSPDSLGNRVPDFSWCGYQAGEAPVPDLPVKITVPLKEGDATSRIQAAIDYLGQLPADARGFRGAILLQKGTYIVGGYLRIHQSGIVLRGSGSQQGGTTILGTGKHRMPLINIGGKDDKILKAPVKITNDYVPVNANNVHVMSTDQLKTGDNVLITRPSTREWIDDLGMAHFGGGITSLGWKPGQRDIIWTRTITAVKDNRIYFDAPLGTALEKKYGGGFLSVFSWPGRIANAGVENLQLISAYDSSNEKDEQHCWMAITIDNAIDCWVRQVGFKHFAGSAVAVYRNASRVTVEDCISLEPVSEIGGERRNTFFTEGQQILFQRCYAEKGIHDFATGFCAAGPIAFVQCESRQALDFSGGIDSWSSAVLFDIVSIDGNSIRFRNRGQDGQGAGWNIANGVLWNCSAARIDCYKPPGAQNWAFGSWSQFSGDGYWGESNNNIEPRSLYYAQLKERLGPALDNRVQVMQVETEASSSPSVETAELLTKLASQPAKSLLDFIRSASLRHPISLDAKDSKTIDNVKFSSAQQPLLPPALLVQNGWLVRGNALLAGGRINVPWWSGSARPYAAKNMGMAITRFVPGKTGRGLTDLLEEVTDSMRLKNIIVLDHNYGLWYDRRRDDHQRVRRMDGDVWAPFYELPFARSGKELAWDGLSKYDLSKFNVWYWDRLRQFAGLADQKGLLLIQQHYFQHNIIEAGAHYADFPWRPANNINNTGFPEPPNYAGDKRIFMAEQFYDTTHPIRRDLHRKYIYQCLDNFAANNGVIHMISEEYTGPLHFVQFWLNTIRQWQNEKGKDPLIALSVTKDVQDAVLADPAFASLVDIIDIKYWHYQADGSVYAPKGGQNLAPRQHARLLKPKSSSPKQVYRAVAEYKRLYPGKVVLYSADGWDRFSWAAMMAGASLPMMKIKDTAFLKALAMMKPVFNEKDKQWILYSEKAGYIVSTAEADKLVIDLSKESAVFNIHWFEVTGGEMQTIKKDISGGKIISLDKPGKGNWILWLRKK